MNFCECEKSYLFAHRSYNVIETNSTIRLFPERMCSAPFGLYFVKQQHHQLWVNNGKTLNETKCINWNKATVEMRNRKIMLIYSIELADHFIYGFISTIHFKLYYKTIIFAVDCDKYDDTLRRKTKFSIYLKIYLSLKC